MHPSKEPLPVKGSFWAKVRYDESSKQLDKVEFIVLDMEAECLISQQTAVELGLVNYTFTVKSVESDVGDLKCDATLSLAGQINQCLEEVSKGLGKLKDHKVKLHTDPNVKLVCQPARRIPFGLQDRVSEKLDELMKADVIERVHKPSRWVSGVVVTPKKDNDIRLCVDLRQVNKAIKVEKHPMPTIEDIIMSLSGAKFFSTIDLRQGFHQLEMDEES